MRIFFFLLLISGVLSAAPVNEALFNEDNVTQEIESIRMQLAANLSNDEQVLNQLSIQKLLLSKIEEMASNKKEDAIPRYKLPNEETLSQEAFIKYFEYGAEILSKIAMLKEQKQLLAKRLDSIKEQLNGYAPSEKSDILQSQLEYAYFKWKRKLNNNALTRHDEFLQAEKPRFLAAFEKTKVDLDELDKENNTLNSKLQNYYLKKVHLELRLERELIRLTSEKTDEVLSALSEEEVVKHLDTTNKNRRYNALRNELNDMNEKISNTIRKKNALLVLHQIYNLQHQDLENYIIVRGVMESFASDLSAEDKKLFELTKRMLEWLKYEQIDDVTTFMYDFREWFGHVYGNIVSVVNTPLFYQNERPIVLFDFIKMLITIMIGFMIARFYKRRINNAQRHLPHIKRQTFKVAGNIGYYIIVLLTLAVSLNNIGLDMSSLSLVAGALSVGIGFGLKEVVGNFVSGIIIMVERSVKIGDFVEIDNSISGNIIDIRMRSVTIKTSSNIDIIVPNSLLVQQSFTNYTLEESIRRLSIPFTVAYGVSYEDVNSLIMDALNQSELNFVRDSIEYENEVIMVGMDERGVNYLLFVYVSTYGPNARSSYFRLVYKTLQDNNIPIPSPRLQVSMAEPVNKSV